MALKTIQIVDACDMPEDVTNYCCENDISTHYQNDIVGVENDGSPLAEWLNSLGIEWHERGWTWIGIFAT